MKILSSKQIRELDAYTVEHEPIKSADLMERAAHECFQWLIGKYDKSKSFKIFCGLGNNGGDGLVIARLLHQAGYKVQPYIVRYSENTSNDFKVNEARLFQLDLSLVKNVNLLSDIQEFEESDVIIDSIFGSGLTRITSGLVAHVISHINNSKLPKVAIDFPSGLFSDSTSMIDGNTIVNADYTLSFQLPKLAFFHAENANHIGDVHILDIGLDKNFIEQQESDFELLELNEIAPLIVKRNRFSHKGTFGHALIISGSYGKIGAASLCTKACLRAGAGLVTVHIPNCGYQIIQTCIPEVMVQSDSAENSISDIIDTEIFTAIGIGPGIGLAKSTQKSFKALLKNFISPIVIDADAINILAQNKSWINDIPENSILTPHPKEFERLIGETKNHFDRIKMQSEFSLENNLYVVLKGHYTCITTPMGKCFFNSTGNPGMATAGSGDALTGILTGLISQGYNSLDACKLGVYLHGLAGDAAAEQHGEIAMITSDLIENIGVAYEFIQSEK